MQTFKYLVRDNANGKQSIWGEIRVLAASPDQAEVDVRRDLNRMVENRQTDLDWYAMTISLVGGEVGRHDWAVGEGCEDGFAVFVDDRQLGYQPTQATAVAHALAIIERLQADGDYRLNDRPAGFLPPPLKEKTDQ